ncbi:MAG: exonuclease domain-containing protein [Christensenellales bacterium]
MVADAPLFPEIWPEIEPFFHGIMAAHSAAFDLGVICKSLAVYGLPIPEITYICSLQKSKKHIPKELYGSHKLNDLCAGLKLPP